MVNRTNNVAYGISQNSETKNYILVVSYENYCEKCGKEYINIKTKFCGTCQFNKDEEINNFIKEQSSSNEIFKWIPYDQFNDIKAIGKGGFATVYSAVWKDKTVALKQLHDSNNISNEFLNEV